MLEAFTIVFAVLILIGVGLLLRRRSSLGDTSRASLGLPLGLGLGGAAGLLLSQVAGTFVYILPVSLGLGMAAGWSIGWLLDSLMPKD